MTAYNLFFLQTVFPRFMQFLSLETSNFWGKFLFLFSQQHLIPSVLNLCVSVASYDFVCLEYLSFHDNL